MTAKVFNSFEFCREGSREGGQVGGEGGKWKFNEFIYMTTLLIFGNHFFLFLHKLFFHRVRFFCIFFVLFVNIMHSYFRLYNVLSGNKSNREKKGGEAHTYILYTTRTFPAGQISVFCIITSGRKKKGAFMSIQGWRISSWELSNRANW